jgi:hypothetical protein
MPYALYLDMACLMKPLQKIQYLCWNEASTEMAMGNFNSIDKFVILYNIKRPHMSLNWDDLATPIKLFTEK